MEAIVDSLIIAQALAVIRDLQRSPKGDTISPHIAIVDVGEGIHTRRTRGVRPISEGT